MRVLFLTHQYFPRWIGGVEVLVRGLVRSLVAAGHEAAVVTYHESPSGKARDWGLRRTAYEGSPLYEIAYNLSCHPQPSRAEYDNALTAGLVGAVVRETRPDVVHVAHAMKLSGAVFPAVREAGVPMVASLSDYWYVCLRHTLLRPDGALCRGPDHRYRCLRCAGATHGFARPPRTATPSSDWRLWLRAGAGELGKRLGLPLSDPRFLGDVGNIALRRRALLPMLLLADRIVALSSFQKQIYVENGVPAERIQVLQHGPPGEPLAAARARRLQRGAPKRLRILCIGTLAPFKGVHILVEALRRVPDLDLEFVVYGGPGPDRAYVESLQQAAERDPRIRLAGTFPAESMPDILLEASVLVHPSLWWENEPFVIKEALFAGVPVAVSDLGSMPELISSVEGCWRLPAGDVEAWAGWLAGLGRQPPPEVVGPPRLPTMEEFSARMLDLYGELAKRAA